MEENKLYYKHCHFKYNNYLSLNDEDSCAHMHAYCLLNDLHPGTLYLPVTSFVVC